VKANKQRFPSQSGDEKPVANRAQAAIGHAGSRTEEWGKSMDYCSRAVLLSAAVALAIAGGASAQDVVDSGYRGPPASDLLPGPASTATAPALHGHSRDRYIHFGGATTEPEFYLIGGSGGPAALAGNISSLAIGAGYRQPLSRALTWHLDLRNHVLQRDYYGDRDAASNFEFSLGLQLSF